MKIYEVYNNNEVGILKQYRIPGIAVKQSQ